MGFFYETSVGKKVAMAASGFVVFGFLVVHLLGNLQIFAGPERLDAYAELLGGLGGWLWALRGLLIVAAVVHVVAATQVTLQSWRARPQGYAVTRRERTTYAARTMRVGGPIIALFVVYHLMHLTFGAVHPDGAGFDAATVYDNVVRGFSVPWVAGVYLVAVALVGLHLYHGLESMFQSVGASHRRFNGWRRGFAVLFALGVTAGNASIPVAVLTGVVS